MLGLLKSMGDFEVELNVLFGFKCILHFIKATSLWGHREDCGVLSNIPIDPGI